MVNKPTGSSKDAAGSAKGGRVPRSQLAGDYFFVVLAVPVNGPRMGRVMTPTSTWHFVDHVVKSAAPSAFQMQVDGTTLQTEKAFRLEVLDLDESFTSEDEVREYLEGTGKQWVKDAVDYRVCRLTIRPRAATGT